MKAMILAAGLGTRLKPFTDNHPKALAIVNGKTLLQRNIEFLSRFGIDDFIINVHHFSNQVISFLKDKNNFGKKISISDESDEVLETGGGISKASWFFKNDSASFVLMNVDVLTDMNLGEMIDQHKKLNPLVTLAVTTRQTSRYFLFDDSRRLCGWRNTVSGEQKISVDSDKLNQKAFSGIHIISPEIFPLIKQEGKFSIVDLYLELAADHRILSFDHSESKFVDVGRPESIKIAESVF